MNSLLPILGAFGGLGALAGAIAILLKVGVEKTDVKIESADRVLVGQDRFIGQLEGANAALLSRIDALERGQEQLRDELGRVVDERDRLRRENADLRARVAHLEERVGDLSRGGAGL